jgi:hypothetical protein
MRSSPLARHDPVDAAALGRHHADPFPSSIVRMYRDGADQFRLLV